MIESAVAMKYLSAGLSALPADRKLKCPLGKWKEWQGRLPTRDEEQTWFANPQDAICIICGKVSGNLEVLDFDNHGELFPKWKEGIPADLLTKLILEQTPSGGFHVAYRCADDVCGNIKLARGVRDGKTVTLIETRGEGGLVLCAPTGGYEMQQGDYASLPCLSHTEREQLLLPAWRLDECKPSSLTTVSPMPDGFTLFEPESSAFEQRPGDDFNGRGDIRPCLEKHGWVSLGVQPDGNEYWRRPGKESGGNSATLKDGIFYVFSSSASPFEPSRGYSPFSVYALLEHNGDFGKAAGALLSEGYGRTSDFSVPDGLDQLIANLTKEKEEPDYFTAREIMKTYPNMREPLIGGLLRKGEVMNLVAAPKTGKSWAVMQLALALASGGDWLGLPCRKSRVLLIDNELHKETLANRLARVSGAMGIFPEDASLDSFFITPQRGKAKNLRNLAGKLKDFRERQFDVIIIDALYKALPPEVDENSNGQITDIYNTLDGYAQNIGAAIVLVHHTSKGNQANKSVTDVGSGAGAQSRAPDTHMALRQHREPGVVSVACCVRSFPPLAKFCIRRDEESNLWRLAPECDPDDLDGRPEKELTSLGQKRKCTPEEVADKIMNSLHTVELPLRKTDFVNRMYSLTESSKAKVSAAVSQLAQGGYLAEIPGDPNLRQQSVKWIDRGPKSSGIRPFAG